MRSQHRSRTLAVALALIGIALGGGERRVVAEEAIARVAVFPVENLTGGSAPTEAVRQSLIQKLAAGRIGVLKEAVLEDFMARHRVRYVAGIDGETADALRKETGVEAIVIASIELSSLSTPPKFALTARLVSIDGPPQVVWGDDAGLSGDDSPGLLDLGVDSSHEIVQAKALRAIGNSLLAYLASAKGLAPSKAASKFRPRTTYRGLELENGRQYSVAVVPFLNLSDRRAAGEILSLLFVRHLASLPQFRVVDTGVVHQQLLNARIIMTGGLSLSDAETIAALADADLILGGRVLRYEDVEGPSGATRVEFSTVLIERKSRKVVWSSDSYNDGLQRLGFFERGMSRTAHTMATQMVRCAAEMIAGREQ